ncbi:MDR family MFS transporter [Allorhizocola rhizosphaerae]|uniref:MDR family MFS transporter n=1 Tax=Allorhizocola rhizosphaerae TaxID=1872709 RepID=UPI000E3DEEC1|nr:MFS transporter [Allorhizocola rhizosphaerae]
MRGLPKTFWALWTGTLINRSGAFVMLYLEIHMVAYYGFSATFAGLVLGLFGAGLAVGSLVGGILADRWGRRGTLLISNLGQAVTAVVVGLTFEALWIAVLAMVFGFWNGLGRAPFSATMVDVLGPSARLRGMNLNYWAINLGFSVAAILAGVLSSAPHMTVFLITAGAHVLTTVLVFKLIPETKPSAVRMEVKPTGSIKAVLTDRVFMVFVSLNLGLWVVIEACKLIPIAMHQRGLDPADYGTVIAVNGVMIVLGQLFVPKLISRRKRTHVLAAAALLVGLGMGAVAVAGTVPLLMLTVVVWTAGEMLNAPVNGAYIADLSQPEMRGRYQGVASSSFTLANFIAPVFGGILLDHAPPATLWVVLAGLGLAVAIGQIVTGPARDRRAALLTQQQGVPVAAVS